MNNIVTTIVFVLACLLIDQCVSAQDSLKHRAIKVYSNIRYINDEREYAGNVAEVEKFIISLSPSIAFYNIKGNFHEIGLPLLSFNYDKDITNNGPIISGGINKTFDIGIRYEYNMRLQKKTGTKLQAFFGFTAYPFFSYQHNSPNLSTSFPLTNTHTGVMFSIIPRIIWNINTRLSIDVDMLPDGAIFGYIYNNTDNPALPEKARKMTTFDFDYSLTPYPIRIGVAYNPSYTPNIDFSS